MLYKKVQKLILENLVISKVMINYIQLVKKLTLLKFTKTLRVNATKNSIRNIQNS